MNFDLVKVTVQSKAVAVALASVASAAAGASGAYLVLSKRLEQKYANLATEEIRQARELYAKKYKADQFADLESVTSAYSDEVAAEPEEIDEKEVRAVAQQIMEKQQYFPYNKIGEKPEAQPEKERIEVMASQRRNVFDNQPIVETDEFDPEKELEKKKAGKPYIITNEEYYDNPEGKQQFTFQYYEDDDVLVDENESPIDKAVADRNLGLGNLRFGYGSSHKNTVLIHNPVSDNQYEIVRVNSSYAKDILGFDPDEDDAPGLRRFRSDD